MDGKARAIEADTGYEFDADLHIHRLGGRAIPGISELLREADILHYGGAGTELASAHAMSRGKAVHLACEFLDGKVGTLNWETVSDEIVGYVMAYEKFKKDTGFKAIRVEEHLFNSTLCYATIIDREGTWKLKPERILLELKTGAPEPWWELQLALQDALLPTLSKNRGWFAVQLKEDGSYALHEFKDRTVKGLALSLVSLFWWKKNHNIGG